MHLVNIAALLQAAPEAHSRRCALALTAVESSRWPAAACGLRTAATLAEDWAQQARTLADWCDAQGESGRAHSIVPVLPSSDDQAAAPLLAGQPTAESIEAGLTALSHALGREHAQRVRRAMSGVLQAQQQTTTPAGAAA